MPEPDIIAPFQNLLMLALAMERAILPIGTILSKEKCEAVLRLNYPLSKAKYKARYSRISKRSLLTSGIPLCFLIIASSTNL
jgi:hypothetical protein